MSGQVPPSSRAGRPNPRARTAKARAVDLYERFTGHEGEAIGHVNLPPVPSSLAVIGPCDGILYTTVRDGKTEHYKHEFAQGDRPLFCISPDGRSIHLVGGRFVFTDRGIVDLSDRKNLPARLRR